MTRIAGVLTALTFSTCLACGASSSPAGAGGAGGASNGGRSGSGASGGGGSPTAGSGGGGSGGGTAGAGVVPDGGTPTATGQFTIIYNGAATPSTLTTCSDCQAWFDVTVNYGVFSLAFENSGGAPHTTTVYIHVYAAYNPGEYWVDVYFLEDNPSYPLAYQGNYYFTNSATAILSDAPNACITLTSVNLATGGYVAGSLDCMYLGGGDPNQQTAELRGTFSATLQ
jgi:hypothetical protein